MDAPFSQTYTVRWSDLDANAHMRNTAYMEYAMQTRMAYFHANDYSTGEFARLQFGPVVLKEELSYFKEIHMMDTITVTLSISEVTADGSRFTMCNDIIRGDGIKATTIITSAAWLDLQARKLMAPPDKLNQLLQRILITQE